MNLPKDSELEARRVDPDPYREQMRLFGLEMKRATAEGIIMKRKPLSGLCKHHTRGPVKGGFGLGSGFS
jgi:hypothetical protein